MQYNPMDNPIIKIISQRVYQAAKDILGNKLYKVYLYGSYARGDYEGDSDMDFMIIANLPQAEACAQISAIYNNVSDVDLKYDVIVSPSVTGSDVFYGFLNVNPFYQNIVNEGVEITD